MGWQRAGWNSVWDGQDLGRWQSNAGLASSRKAMQGEEQQGLVALCMALS